MRIILKVSLLFIFAIVFVTAGTWSTNNSALAQPGYLSYEDCPECETEVANFNLHVRKLKEAGYGQIYFSVPVILVNNVELAKQIAQRCLASCSGADSQFLTTLSIKLIQVYSIFGNNPFDPLRILSGGDTTGRRSISAIHIYVPSLNKTGWVPLLCIKGGKVTNEPGCPFPHLHDTITLKRTGDSIDDPAAGACGHGLVELKSKDELLPEFQDLCEGLL